MTNYINRRHEQTIVYWQETGRSGAGESTFAAPVEITGRWEDRQLNFTDNTGKESIASSVVFVDQDIKAGDWVLLGTIAGIASSEDDTNPNKVTNAREIRGFNKIPNLKADKFLRMGFMKPR